MTALITEIGVFIVALACYMAGFLITAVVALRSLDRFSHSANPSADNLEYTRIRDEIRDVMSILLLDLAEQGEHLTAIRIIERCPDYFSQGKAREIWDSESYRMALEDID
jgi:hypothetical protein